MPAGLRNLSFTADSAMVTAYVYPGVNDLLKFAGTAFFILL